jgi:uncharacterized protein
MKNKKNAIIQEFSCSHLQYWFTPLRGGLGRGFTLLLLFLALGAQAQTECRAKLDTIKKIMEKDLLYKDYSKMFKDLLPCVEAGSPLAQNYVGLFYLDGLGIDKDEAKGFKYTEQAALNKHPIAQNNLGNLYRTGRACELNMDKAVYWYQKAANAKNARAAYSLGYMYLKGFGVPQNYETAVAWFQKSKVDMAKHWLGVCYYLGYGVAQNTEKALEYFLSNGTPNSKAFLKNIKTSKRDTLINQTEQAIEIATEGNKKIDAEILEENRVIIDKSAVEHRVLQTQSIIGEWTGRWIEYDYSGKIPTRILPIEISFSKNELGELQTKIVFQEKTFDNTVLFENNNLFLQDFNFKLEQLYKHSFQDYKLDYKILGMQLSQKIYNNIPYLLANVDATISTWQEPAPPISLVLRPKNEIAISSQDQEVLLALSTQKAEFIKVYPVPFKEQLYICFDLANPAQLAVTLTSTTTAQTISVASTNLPAGMQSYTVNTAHLPTGYYVVRVQENEKLHTRIVIKQ